MPRYFMELCFDGTPYRGWQRQAAAPSVQEEVERALRLKLRLPDLFVVGCGRTDTGVHASSYFLHFETGHPLASPEAFSQAMNSLLPPPIAVKGTFAVEDKAHARFSATEREYTYLVHRRKDPFLHDRSYLLRPELDVEAMNSACSFLVGKQDFSCFQRTGSDNRTSICDVRQAVWTATGAGYRFTITADRYLRNMVRAIVGTCIRMGKGQWKAEDMQEILASKDRSRAGKSAPACGLYLSRIAYPFIQAEQA
ncbi:MAG: tRNA pseudouridine(38-40) synthase TruA [Bacteroidetes bacterium]|nr:tRNA pseudouridine(38-40) synthase TruA [Bacteroidota bacterium]MBS1940387.1 tRNA pseudouridine(38-40) synthase TruA [Bacteroidota bacterium]